MWSTHNLLGLISKAVLSIQVKYDGDYVDNDDDGTVMKLRNWENWKCVIPVVCVKNGKGM